MDFWGIEESDEETLEEYQRDSKEYICIACEYKWQSKKDFGTPCACPNCRSKNIAKYAETKEGIEKWKKNNQ